MKAVQPLLGLAAIALVLTVAACGGSSETPPAPPDTPDTGTSTDAPDETAVLDTGPSIDIGDVEQALTILGTVADLSIADNIVETPIRDARDRLKLVNIEVTPPNPNALWLGIRLESTRDFIERPVILKTDILVDGNPIDSFTVPLQANVVKNHFQRDVNVLFGMDVIPETMLVSMESEALLLPEGTKIEEIDVYAVTEGDRTKAITDAPLRIDFTEPGTPISDADDPEPANEPAAEETDSAAEEPAPVEETTTEPS